ncbi:LysR substrate-binding domain-containing protein [Sphingomonas sp.]|uniref:LysR substrate-binding domain-containing protein n=1 Tax=Sphingomonas sp. TaxID=28214 RepID=UPI0025FF9045|nr:LysR substrate-binding domain-containing protein [Sphingomonas sp.]
MMFELMQLRCFVAVAEELHFGKAASRMNMTQPPLSRQIQILERILDVELFKRSSRSVELTAAGAAFMNDARRIVRLADNARLTARRAATGEIGALTLGFTAASGYSFVPKLVSHARAALPNVDLRLKEMVSTEQIDALMAGQIDIGLLRPPLRRAELDSQFVMREGLSIACLDTGVDGRPPPRTLADFDDLPVVMYSPDGARYFHDLVQGLMTNAGVAPRYVQYLSQIHSILALVGAGLGAAIVPDAARALHMDGISFHPLEEARESVELMLAWRHDNDNPAIQRFLTRMETIGG